MRILIVHQYFKTPEEGGGIRSWHIAKYLGQKGHDVLILSTHNKLSGLHRFEEFDVHYFKIQYKNSMSFIRRTLSFFSYVVACKRFLKKDHQFHEAYVLTTPLTTGLIAQSLESDYNIPYHFEVGDLWPDVPIRLGIIKNSILKRLLYTLELKTYQNSKSIVALSPAIEELIREKVQEKAINVITNFSDLDWFGYRKLDNTPFSDKNPFIIAYYGAMGYANHVEFVLDAAKECEKKSLPVKFRLMGFGAFSAKIQALSRSLQNTEWFEPGGMEDVKNLLQSSHATYISYLNNPILNTGSPNKLFDGLTASHLIITNFNGWIGDLISRHNCGFSYEPRNPQMLVDKLLPIITDLDHYHSIQENSRKLAERNFDKNVQLKKLDEIFR